MRTPNPRKSAGDPQPGPDAVFVPQSRPALPQTAFRMRAAAELRSEATFWPGGEALVLLMTRSNTYARRCGRTTMTGHELLWNVPGARRTGVPAPRGGGAGALAGAWYLREADIRRAIALVDEVEALLDELSELAAAERTRCEARLLLSARQPSGGFLASVRRVR